MTLRYIFYSGFMLGTERSSLIFEIIFNALAGVYALSKSLITIQIVHHLFPIVGTHSDIDAVYS